MHTFKEERDFPRNGRSNAGGGGKNENGGAERGNIKQDEIAEAIGPLGSEGGRGGRNEAEAFAREEVDFGGRSKVGKWQ